MGQKFDQELDTQGMVCPKPALLTKKTLRGMMPGKILKVITDYKPASESVPRDLKKTSHKLLGVEFDEDEEIWEIFFECVK